ncbi:MAG: glucose-6-phosphate dehydrogenase assembly protein OpcA [Bdellovibrionales bacterium]|nr:glucose-6-phosphate dehydrogenase assembly protein OpcA [Bdellovibrionales bacterium]
MVETTAGFIPTTTENLRKTLDELVSDIRGAEGSVYLSARKNFIALFCSKKSNAEIAEWVELLSSVSPSRTFLLLPDASHQSISASVSARCNEIRQSEHVCCEVIRLDVPLKGWRRVLSLIRANLITGAPTELFLIDPNFQYRDYVNRLASLSDEVLFSSEGSSESLQIVSGIESVPKKLVDFDWLRLVTWRDELRDVFESERLQSYLPKLREVEVGYRVEAGPAIPPEALLLSGWILVKLGMEVTARASSHFECIGIDGSRLKLKFVSENPGSSIGLTHLTFRFGGGSSDGDRNPKKGYSHQSEVTLRAHEQLETHVRTAEFEYRTSRSLPRESLVDVVSRFFRIGDSLEGYRRALRAAVEIDLLEQGFRN